jgi:hypothetical protein
MHKLLKIISFPAICLIAAYVGNNLAKADINPHMKCYTWRCTGSVGQCTLSGPEIQTCFTEPNEHCVTYTNQYMMCNGTLPNMQQCYWFYNKCL